MALTRWTAAENKFKQHLSSTTSATATTTGTGAGGLDIGNTVFLGGTRVLWLFGDTFWSTASGQSRPTTFGNLIHNCVALQTGLDLSSCTLAYYSGGTAAIPHEFFPNTEREYQPLYKYPMGGVVLDDVLLVTGMYSRAKSTNPNNFGTSMSGSWAQLFWGFGSGAPTTWPGIEVPFNTGHSNFHENNQYVVQGSPIDAGDGYVYFWAEGPSQSNRWATFRMDRNAVKAGDMSAPYWWDGQSKWIRDMPDPRTGTFTRHRHNVFNFSIQGSDQAGSVVKRPDGNYQATLIPHDWFNSSPTVGYSKITSPGNTFASYTSKYSIPLPITGDFVYDAFYLPEQTWSGKAAGDQLWVWSRNNIADPTPLVPFSQTVIQDARTYWMDVLQLQASDVP